MSSDKRVHPATSSGDSDSDSPVGKLLRLESGSESDDASRAPLHDTDDEDWQVVDGRRKRRTKLTSSRHDEPPHQLTSPAAAASASVSTAANTAPIPAKRHSLNLSASSPASTAAPNGPPRAPPRGLTESAAASTSAGAHSDTPPDHAASRHSAPINAKPKVIVRPTPGFETALDIAEALEELLSSKFHMKFLESGSVVVTPPTEDVLQALLSITTVEGKPVELRLMGEATTKGVITAYPVAMPLKVLLRHPDVVSAERCHTRDGLATRQVHVTLKGPLPGSIDLGSWGTFYTRPFNQEPLRCYRCQQFGHHQARCNRQAVCGMCSGPHMTETCLSKYKAGEEVQAQCPNCKEHHHAWSRRCPYRVALVERGMERQEAWQAAHNPSRPAWTRRSRSRSRPQPPPPGHSALASREEFPLLPQSPLTANTASTSNPAPRRHARSSSRAGQPPRATTASVPTHQQGPATSLPQHPPLPQPQRRHRNRNRNPAPQVTPPGSILVTKAALEGMLASFAVALSGLLNLTPDTEALRGIAKATVEEHFPAPDPQPVTPAPPHQPLNPPPSAAHPAASDTTAPPAVEASVDAEAPPPAAQPAASETPAPAAVEATMDVEAPTPASQSDARANRPAVQFTIGCAPTPKPVRSHIPVRAAPSRSRLPLPERKALPKRRGPAAATGKSSSKLPVTAKGSSA